MLESPVTIELEERLIEQLQAAGVEQRELNETAHLALARAIYGHGFVSLGLAAEMAGRERPDFLAQLSEAGEPVVVLSEDQAAEECDLIESMLGRKEQGQ